VGSLSLHIRYRPIRIGWCIESTTREHVHDALRLTHAFAGGRFNPLIPVDVPELAEDLIDRFRVDVLFPVAATERINAFVAAHNYLLWPDFEKKLFYEQWQHIPPRAAFVDVYHAARRLREERVRRRKLLLVTCADDDPLATVILASAGHYPTASTSVPNYEEIMAGLLGVERITLTRDDPVPPTIRTRITPARLTTLDLESYESVPDHGVYMGDVRNVEDVTHFWNLRAAGSSLVFFDPSEAARLGPLLEAHKRWLASIPAKPWREGGAVTVYGREVRESPDLTSVAERVLRRQVDPVIWNGLNIRPALHHWKDQSVLGSVEESERTPSVTFALPQKPLYDVPELSQQHLAVSVQGSDPWNMRDATFFPPYIPELNEYYGRQLYFQYAHVRAEPPWVWRSIAVIVHSSTSDLTLRALPTSELAAKLFDRFGMIAKPSQAGLVTTRLVAQMGGLQGCRVFKVEGVRTLISKYSPDQSFTRSNAKQMIGNADPATGRPRFEPFEDLFIDQRPFRQKLKPEDALDFLLRRGVFRVGLELKCANCELPFWQPLDDLKTKVECVYCGIQFSVADQLRDRDWAYRRSGLFGRDDNQHGGVPVAVTLQQLDTALHSDRILYTTSVEVTPGTSQVDKCESDFVVITSGPSHNYPHQPQLVVGECKAAGGTVTVADAEHLGKIADAFPSRRLNAFVLFAKTGAFSEDEIAACARAQHRWRSRVIVLSKNELEPYDVYDRHKEEPRLHAAGLEDMAAITSHLYPALRPTGFGEMERERRHQVTDRRAFELFEARGRDHGRDWEDWFRAEDELRGR
jgi:hypothetical protein